VFGACAAETLDIVETSGVKGGLVVVLGCKDVASVAKLLPGDGYLVSALDTDADAVAAVRKAILSEGSSGKVTVDVWNGETLPYVDNLVSLLVADELGSVPEDEVMRVLSPDGVALIGDRKTIKPRPDTIDEWTHWLYNAGGNAVGRDTVAGPPRHFQWTALPRWSSHHDTVLTTSALVTSGGRIFAIVNEAPISEFHAASQGNWFLTARDAFNGVLLWKVPMPGWGWRSWGESFAKRFAQPMQLPSRLVAQGDRVYVTLGFHAPLSVLDASTGEMLRTYERAGSVDEILLHDGRLIVAAYDPNDSPKSKTVRAIDLETGRQLWESGPHVGVPARYDVVERWAPLTLTAHGKRVVFVAVKDIVCLDLESGQERWRKERPAYREHRMHLGVRQSENCTLVNHEDIVLFAQPVGKLGHTNHTVPCDLYAFSAKTGQTLWQSKCGTWAWGHPADVFAIDDLVWVHEHIPTQMKGPSPVKLNSLDHALLALDLCSGEVRKRIGTTDIFRIGHHHRCYRNKATTRYAFTSRRGTETTDLDSGEIRLHPWVRSECRFGVVPANGLLYTAPHPCACYPGVKLTGFCALAPERTTSLPLASKAARLERGAVYGSSLAPPIQSGDVPAEWRTHRGNASRNGCAPTHLGTKADVKWRCQLHAPLSAPTAAGGSVYVAEKDRHAVVALDAATGRVRWRFVSGGRVDSPPSIAASRVVFGSADGSVYCLTAAEGELVWRFRVAPRDMRMVADGQFESVWPVHGSVLVRDGEVLATAGRSTYLDGGLHACRLDLATGRLIEQKPLSHERLVDRKELTSRAVRYDHYNTDGAVSDLLTAGDQSVFLKAIPVFGDGKQDGPMLVTHSGLLDGTMFERSFWYVVRPDGQPIGAQLMVHDDKAAFGFKAYPSAQRGGPWHVIGTGYTLFSASLRTSKAPSAARSVPTHVPDFYHKPLRRPAWQVKVPVRARAMVLADNVLLLAGSPDVVREGTDPYASVEGKLGGRMLVVDRKDGGTLAEHELGAMPVWDGMAVVGSHVYIAMRDGSVTCVDTLGE